MCEADRDPHQQRFGKEVRFCVACGKNGLFHSLYCALKKCGTGRSNLHLVKEFDCDSWIDVLAMTHSYPEFWGRGLSLASGIKLAHPDATVVLATQASYFFMEGGGALFQAASKNSDLTCVILDGQWKLLQRSEREEAGEWSSGGVPLNPIALLLLSGATFVAQVHSDEVEDAAAIIDLAIRHTGFSAVYMVTSRPLLYPENRKPPSLQRIERIGPSHPVEDQAAALALATAGEGLLRTGVFYRIDRPISEERREPLRNGAIQLTPPTTIYCSRVWPPAILL